MAKIKIAQNPTFEAEVKIPRVGGDPVPVMFTFRYLDRASLSRLYDTWNKAADEMAKASDGEDVTLEQFTASQAQLQVDQIKAVVVGWGFDDKFTDEAIAELVNTFVGVPQAVLEAFQRAYNPARLGN